MNPALLEPSEVVAFKSFIFLLAVTLATWGRVNAAIADECTAKTGALGTSRTIVLDPSEHSKVGTMSYEETLPLSDKEVVLTFDDGPVHLYTEKILDILASECVRATFFIVGRMAKAHPELVRRAVDEGHTIGTHTMSHPLRFRALDEQRAQREIDEGIDAVKAALGDSRTLGPFFRFPGFGRTDAAEEYLGSRHLMIWSADFPADDWRRIPPAEVARRALSRLEAKGKGILLLHDIHQRTVEALPLILEQLKARGFRIVNVVPVGPNRPETQTTAAAWHPTWRSKDLSLAGSATAEVKNDSDPPSKDSDVSNSDLKMMQATGKGSASRRRLSAHLDHLGSRPKSAAYVHVVQ